VEDTVRSVPKHDWTDLAASIQPKTIDPVVEKSKPAPAAAEHNMVVPSANAQPATANPLPPVPPVLKPLAKTLENKARSMPRLEWAELAASLQPKAVEPVTETPRPASPITQAPETTAVPVVSTQQASTPSTVAASSAPAENSQAPSANAAIASTLSATSTPAAPPDPALVEAVVQRVLEKMRPQVVDIITKEFLRPVVQALVHREIMKR
jgi:hypothetical protein